MTLLMSQCDLQGPDDLNACDRPVRFYALATASPDGWGLGWGACVGGYCCREHADAEQRPPLDAVLRTFEAIPPTARAFQVWQQLIDAYPEPIEIDASDINETTALDDLINLVQAEYDRLYNQTDHPASAGEVAEAVAAQTMNHPAHAEFYKITLAAAISSMMTVGIVT